MKRRTIWEVNTGEALTVKRHTMVATNQEVEDDVKDAPPIFEEGIQATIDELKEINTDTTKDVLRIGLINNKCVVNTSMEKIFHFILLSLCL